MAIPNEPKKQSANGWGYRWQPRHGDEPKRAKLVAVAHWDAGDKKVVEREVAKLQELQRVARSHAT